MGCVYLATNRVNGRQYVGKTRYGLKKRIAGHRDMARNGLGWLLHRAIRKYGPDAFDWDEVHSNVPEDDLNQLEIDCIKWFGSKAPDGYNLTDGGDGGAVVFSDESKVKMKAYHNRPDVKEYIRKVHLGRKRPAETGRKISEACKGRKAWNTGLRYTGNERSEECKARMKKAQNRPEVKSKISASMRGRPKSSETRAKMKLAWVERRARHLIVKRTDEWKQHIRSVMLEKWKDPEYVAKRKESHDKAMLHRKVGKSWVSN